MFCDLVGSTSLASTLDAEDWRDLVGAYLDDAAKAIGQYGGHVAKKLGDGLMALFGYPRAQENDAERAARAGLTLLRALEDLNATNDGRGLPALAARIGLDSGAVVVDSAGEVFGDAPNLAARAQSAAEPGTMLVTAAVQRGRSRRPVRRRRQRPALRNSKAHQVQAGSAMPDHVAPQRRRAEKARGARVQDAACRSRRRSRTARQALAADARAQQTRQFIQRSSARAGRNGKSRLIDGVRKGPVSPKELPHSWIEWASSQLLQNTALHPRAGRMGKADDLAGTADVAPGSRLADRGDPRSRKSSSNPGRVQRRWRAAARYFDLQLLTCLNLP
jgi:class 3 adenylate cyclase